MKSVFEGFSRNSSSSYFVTTSLNSFVNASTKSLEFERDGPFRKSYVWILASSCSLSEESKECYWKWFFTVVEAIFLRNCRSDFSNQVLKQKIDTCTVRSFENEVLFEPWIKLMMVHILRNLILILIYVGNQTPFHDFSVTTPWTPPWIWCQLLVSQTHGKADWAQNVLSWSLYQKPFSPNSTDFRSKIKYHDLQRYYSPESMCCLLTSTSELKRNPH